MITAFHLLLSIETACYFMPDRQLTRELCIRQAILEFCPRIIRIPIRTALMCQLVKFAEMSAKEWMPLLERGERGLNSHAKIEITEMSFTAKSDAFFNITIKCNWHDHQAQIGCDLFGNCWFLSMIYSKNSAQNINKISPMLFVQRVNLGCSVLLE